MYRFVYIQDGTEYVHDSITNVLMFAKINTHDSIS